MRTLDKLTMGSLVNAGAERYSSLPALETYGKDDIMTFLDVSNAVRAIGASLQDLRIEKGDRVAIFAQSCRNWGLAYLAITSIGATAAVILPDFESSQALDIIAHSQARAVFVSAANYPKIKGAGCLFFCLDDLSYAPAFLLGDDIASCKGPSLIGTRTLDPRSLDSNAEETDLASIIYTSGTTGNPKGVELTHRNLLWNAVNSTPSIFKMQTGMVFLSILPMAHAYEFTLGFLVPLLWGCHVVYLGRKLTTPVMMAAMKACRPHIMLTVPLLIEKVVRKAVFPKLEGKLGKALKLPLIKGLVYKAIGRQLIDQFGGRLKFFGIGGAALDPEIESFLEKIGFPYAIGYGLTETSPLVAGCGPSQHRKGTIGPIIPGLDTKITEEGELVVKGPSVMRGYYKAPDLTKAAFTADGYFRTGDICAFEEGRLVIKGRIKDMILTASGENVYPEAIESLINACENVEESIVIPEGNSLTALIRIDLEARAKNLALDISEAKDEALKYIAAIKSKVNQALPAFSKINSVELVQQPFERTPTLKIKRYKIASEHKKAN